MNDLPDEHDAIGAYMAAAAFDAGVTEKNIDRPSLANVAELDVLHADRAWRIYLPSQERDARGRFVPALAQCDYTNVDGGTWVVTLRNGSRILVRPFRGGFGALGNALG